MKYTEAWSSVVTQNFNLKLMAGILAVISLVLGLVSLKLTFKDSIIVERSCYSKVLAKGDDKRTPQEIEAFIKEALIQRFNTDAQPSEGLVSDEEMNFRIQEQKELKSRGITQKVIFNAISQLGNDFKIEADRLLSVGEIRSAFKFPLVVKLESKVRSSANPYGLTLVSTKAIEKEDKK